MRRIAFFTSTRAEYGLLRPLMAEVAARPNLALQVIASGTHLSEAHGATWREIVADGFPIAARVEMAIASDDSEGVALSAAQVLSGVASALARLRPDVLVLLGDRYELLAAAQAAVLARVPIAHIHGGEATEGAIDESIRHAVTKLSHWHFAAAEPYAERIRQMGEAQDRVWNVGAPAMDNIAALDPVPKDDLERFLGLTLRAPAFLVTYHPVTLEEDGGLAAMQALLAALDTGAGSVVITGANADPGANAIRASLQAFADERPDRVVLVESLGARRYLSLMRHVDAVVGNSSSGLLEAPAVGVPTVDIGPRQQGRLRAPSVLHCGESAAEIRQALDTALSAGHRAIAARRESPYGRPGAARRIVDQLSTVNLAARAKPFVDRRCAADA
ncbi:UDP-N-acetylglucosamine 2-epimerase (hydrolyzing) [Roseateles sp. DAIF2]|uniref:UDP-N-acetylglucosamine 2-epimerase n=1 Tax=Roseateles sp. DAIF2 TaxID=2714952 RepID=UPI0018A33624|nr:UDP-N-acetylglucosamine 2-epimerase [Roseateles sp. DAIF2]QPF72733.1 UDP-N-acetylglucosamine 2-epimerase (hydrolyzing) [Roseateles sp. DAIF2]